MDENKKIDQLQIAGMDCADCAVRIEKEVNKLVGIKLAKVDFIQSKLQVEYDQQAQDFAAIEKAVRRAGYSMKHDSNLQQSTLVVEGMDCPDESIPIENHLKKIEGIHSIRFNLLQNKLILQHTIPLSVIQNQLRELGFKSHPAGKSESREESYWRKNQLLLLTILSGLFASAGILFSYLQSTVLPSLAGSFPIAFFVMAIVAGGFHIAKKGWAEAKNLTLGINFLMSIAIIGAMFIGEWDEAAMVVFLFALAQVLENRSVAKARRSIQSLIQLAPQTALVKHERGSISVAVEEVQIGDTVIIKPGERIPLDGRVQTGESSVNQAPITGESMPVRKQAQDEVFAGSINGNGTLEVKVSKSFHDSTLSRIIHLVEEAQSQKAPSQSFVEKFARYYTPAVVSFAALLAFIPPLFFGASFDQWFYRSLVLLVISCPCALVISTPVTIVSGLANAARNGILIKGGVHLENFANLRALAFDKTGTLTVGKPQVQNIIQLNGFDKMNLLTIAASVESRSEHPLARAIVDFASEQKIALKSIDKFEAIPGQGVKAVIDGESFYVGNHRMFEENGWCVDEIHTHLDEIEQKKHSAIIVGNQGGIWGIIDIADTVRENAVQAVQNLHRAGIRKTIMLTGDNQQTAETIAREIGMDEYKAELMPQDKVTAIKELLQKYKRVAMVGDGINDAPALAAATIGVSMGASGSDTALETADIALMKDDLSKLAYLKSLSRKTVRIIKENIAVALFLKAIFFGLAIPGLATLWMAVFADMGASLIVVFNGLRALKTAETDLL